MEAFPSLTPGSWFHQLPCATCTTQLTQSTAGKAGCYAVAAKLGSLCPLNTQSVDSSSKEGVNKYTLKKIGFALFFSKLHPQ